MGHMHSASGART